MIVLEDPGVVVVVLVAPGSGSVVLRVNEGEMQNQHGDFFGNMIHVQGSAKRCFLGCVNSLPGCAWLQLSKQPRLFADLCSNVDAK